MRTAHASQTAGKFTPGTAAAAGLACCHVCLKVAPADLHECPLCGASLHLRKPDSIQRALALLITAIVLYIPANVLPIMTTFQLGVPTDSTIIGSPQVAKLSGPSGQGRKIGACSGDSLHTVVSKPIGP